MLTSTTVRLLDQCREPLSPSERIAQQERCLQEYLGRLDRQQWRDPVTGLIRARRRPTRAPDRPSRAVWSTR